MKTITIPGTIEEAKTALDGLGELLTAKAWERAAIVAAFTRLDERGGDRKSEAAINRSSEIDRLTPEKFAALGIHGLQSGNTVRLYVQTWQAAQQGIITVDPISGKSSFDAAELDPAMFDDFTPTAGEAIDLPTHIPWPPTRTGTDGYETETGLTSTIKRAVEKHGGGAVTKAVIDTVPEPEFGKTVAANPSVSKAVRSSIEATDWARDEEAAKRAYARSKQDEADAVMAQLEDGNYQALRLLDSAIAALRNLSDEVDRNPVTDMYRWLFDEKIANARHLLDMISIGGSGTWTDNDREFLAGLEGQEGKVE